MSARPDYLPAQRVAAWLSSEDVKAAVARVVSEQGDAAKGFGWDMLQEIELLMEPPATREVGDG